MIRVPQLLLDVREIGESIITTNRDVQLLLRPGMSSDNEALLKIKHARDLLNNIISMLTFFTSLNHVNFDHKEELLTEVKRIEFSCLGLQSVLSSLIDDTNLYKEVEKRIEKFTQIVNESAYRMVTISLVAKLLPDGQGVLGDKAEEVCYKNRLICEQHCDGACYQDDDVGNLACPEYTETFTSSPLTHVESGLEGGENMYWHKYPISLKEIDLDTQTHLFEKNSNEEISTQRIDDRLSDTKFMTPLMDNNDLDVRQTNPSHIKHTLSRTQEESEYIAKHFNNENTVLRERNSIQDDTKTKIYEESLNDTTESTTTKSNDMFSTISSENKSNDLLDGSNKLINTPIYNYILTTTNSHLQEDKMDSSTTSYFEKIADEEFTSVNEITTETIKYSFYNLYYSGFSRKNEIFTLKNTLYVTDVPTTPNYETTENPNTPIYETPEDATTPIYETTEDLTTPIYETTEDPTTPIYETTEDPTTPIYETTEDPTTPIYETTEDPTTPIYQITEDPTQPIYETTEDPTTPIYEKTEVPTTPTYETTTQDLYKFSQDIYSVAQDLSTKANEISSMNSDISSKISNINSIMSDINSYDNDELSKSVQNVNKLTQDMNSKTSEISSLCSSMSSLASDISSASSDMPSADRSNRLRTSPWQKISTKGQDLVATAQGVVSASQEMLMKADAVKAATSAMSGGAQVTSITYEITSKTQLLISETLGLVSAVIDLINVIDS